MRATVLHGKNDVRFEDVPEPTIQQSTDAVIRLAASCVCGSDLWPYRGDQPMEGPMAMGHEYCGVVEAVGDDVTSVKPGQFVVGSFVLSDNTCPHCKHGFQSSCEQREFMTGAQAPMARVPLADGTLVALDERGRTLSSPQLAETMARFRDDGRRTLAFAIGGADGHGRALLDRADLKLSFGPMVWPHMLARAMLSEQLFRATSILAGTPYHRV